MLRIASVCCLALGMTNLKAAEPRELIENLGHRRYVVRLDAETKLEQLGMSAIPWLEQASRHADPEIRTRAARLRDVIELRDLAEGLRTPTYVRLQYTNIPLRQAVTLAGRELGLNLVLDPNKVKQPDRLVTIEIPRSTTWDAFEQILSQTGLMETNEPVQYSASRRIPFPNVILQTPSIEGSISGPTLGLKDVESGSARPWQQTIGCLRFRLVESQRRLKSSGSSHWKIEVTASGRHAITKILALEMYDGFSRRGEQLLVRSDEQPIRGEAVSEMIWLQQPQGGGRLVQGGGVMVFSTGELRPLVMPSPLLHQQGIQITHDENQSIRELRGVLQLQQAMPARKLARVDFPFSKERTRCEGLAQLQEMKVELQSDGAAYVRGEFLVEGEWAQLTEGGFELRLQRSEEEATEPGLFQMRSDTSQFTPGRKTLRFEGIVSASRLKSSSELRLQLFGTKTTETKLPVQLLTTVTP
jgi:hypothetical protein